MRVAKTEALIGFAVTTKLICIFFFAYIKSHFSYDEAHIFLNIFKHGSRISFVKWLKFLNCYSICMTC